MGVGVTEGRDPAIEAAGTGATGSISAFVRQWTTGDDGSARHALSLRVTEDRVLIKADREDHAPTQTEAGLYVAQSMAAAVDGSDEADSWFVGTIVQLGPLVNKRDCRKVLIKWLLAMEEEGLDVPIEEIMRVRQRVEEMLPDNPDPLKVNDRVCFSWASGQAINVDGERYVVLRAGDVLGVLEEG